MPNQSAMKIWVPTKELETLSKEVPLEQIVEAASGQLVKAILPNAGHLGGLAKTRMLVKVGYWRSPEGDVTGAFGSIKADRHSMYPRGLVFTTYSEIDVKYHLRSRTVTQQLGSERIEVLEPDNGRDLDRFVWDALKMYATLGLKRDQREQRLLFYQPIPTA